MQENEFKPGDRCLDENAPVIFVRYTDSPYFAIVKPDGWGNPDEEYEVHLCLLEKRE